MNKDILDTPESQAPAQQTWRAKLLARYRNRGDTEVGQALVRVAVMLVVVSYPTAIVLGGGHPEWSWLWAAGGFLLFAIGILAWIGIDPRISPVRRTIAMIADIAITTYALWQWNGLASPLALMYLWYSLANGFRYGQRYLVASSFMSVTGFAVVLYTSPFWSDIRILGAGILAANIVFPFYMGKLQMMLRQAIAEAEAAKLEAETANQAKSDFLATMSHELRTPLHSIIGWALQLMDTPLTDQQRQNIQTVVTAAKNLSQLVDDILDITKIESGKLTINPVAFDLHALITNTGSLLALPASEKGLRFLVHIDPSTPYLLIGDELRLRQILINLTGNATRFTEKGHIEIRVSLEREVDDVAWIAFSVTDTGQGIEKEAQARIFERFEQADNSITRKHGGSGLGLTISRELVDAMGGEISLSSAPGVGTTFSFCLPFERQHIGDESLQLNGKVLIVTRDSELAQRCSEWLRSWGMAVHAAKDLPQSALVSQIREGLYNNVLVDERCLESVHEFAYAVGSLETILQQSVVLLRRLAMPPTAILLQAGLSVALTLPIDKRLLFNAVHTAQAEVVESDRVVKLAAANDQVTQELSLSVLVADDTAVNRELLCAILQRAGHRPYACQSGKEAIDVLTEKDFDLAIVDLHMPEKSGIDIIKAYQTMDPLGATMPFIVLTADSTPLAAQRCKEVGADMLLPKPIQPFELIQAINQVVKRQSHGVPYERRKTPRLEPNPVVDYEYLISLGVRPEFISEQTKILDTDIRGHIASLIELRKQGKFAEFREIAHTMFGSASGLAASAFAKECRRLEQSSPSYLASDEGARAVSAMLPLFEKAVSALQAYTKTSSGA